jgi:hypothetical protein
MYLRCGDNSPRLGQIGPPETIQYPAARAANRGADGPTGTINTTADGPTGINNTAADSLPVHPEMDNEICEARVGSSRHAAWVLHVIRFDLDALPANPRNRRAIIIGGSIATPSGIAGGSGQMRCRYRLCPFADVKVGDRSAPTCRSWAKSIAMVQRRSSAESKASCGPQIS